MRQRRSTQTGFSGSLDSIVDIVTNSLGVLILAATLTVLGSRGLKISLGTPIIAEADPALERIDFECRGNRVTPIDFSCVEQERQAIHNSAAPLDDRRAMIEEFNARRVENGFHRFELREWGFDPIGRMLTSMILLPLDRPAGDTVSALTDGTSEFQRRLAGLDPRRQLPTFYVQPDSFEVFRRARKVAKEAGFQIGWHPLRTEHLSFGPGGEADIVDY